jgi:hypothetical protein
MALGCQELVDCVRTGVTESCAKFAATCASQKAGEESETLAHNGAKLEVHGSQGVYVGRRDGTVFVFRRGAESSTGALLVVPPSGAAYTVPDMVFVESSNGSSWWHSARENGTYDGISSTYCGSLFECLKEGGCTNWARDCMRHAPRKALCESGGTLKIEGQPATIPLKRCSFEGGSMTLGSDRSSFYIVYTRYDGALDLLPVPREGTMGAASRDRQWYKLDHAAGVYTMKTRALPPELVPLIDPAPVGTDPPCSETLGACIAGPDLSQCAERARDPCTVKNTGGGTLLYDGASIVLSSIGYDGYGADENNVYILVYRSAELLVVPRRAADKPTLLKVESVAESVWRVRRESRVLIWVVVGCGCAVLLFLLWIATRRTRATRRIELR